MSELGGSVRGAWEISELGGSSSLGNEAVEVFLDIAAQSHRYSSNRSHCFFVIIPLDGSCKDG